MQSFRRSVSTATVTLAVMRQQFRPVAHELNMFNSKWRDIWNAENTLYLIESTKKCLAIAETGDRVPTIDRPYKPNIGVGQCPFGGGARSPSNTMWPGPRSSCTISNFSTHKHCCELIRYSNTYWKTQKCPVFDFNYKLTLAYLFHVTRTCRDVIWWCIGDRFLVNLCWSSMATSCCRYRLDLFQNWRPRTYIWPASDAVAMGRRHQTHRLANILNYYAITVWSVSYTHLTLPTIYSV